MKKQDLLPKLKRYLLHAWCDLSDSQKAVTSAVRGRLQSKISASEAKHSGQIRLCVEAALPLSYIWRGLASRARAITLFGKLRVWDTERNNGVLIYVLLAERKIEIVADRGLTKHVNQRHWQSVIVQMQASFKACDFESGLAFAIEQVSLQLIAHFPDTSNDTNELPDAPIVQ